MHGKSKLILERESKGFTQKQMAGFMHVSKPQYQSGEVKITNDEWEKIAKALEVDVQKIKEEDIIQSILII